MKLSVLYLCVLAVAGFITATLLPLFCRTLGKYLTDRPGGLKTHTHPVPLVGGLAVFTGTLVSLLLLRVFSNFPTGTLHRLRGIFIAGTLIFVLGLLDDLHKPKGLPVTLRLAVQALAAATLMYYGVHIDIFTHAWANYLLSFWWLVGLINAFNLLDIMDGLCVSQAVLCTAGLVWIALPGEFWYVNFAALALLGACLSFWPCNQGQPKIFLGDSGATFLGFMIAALSMGAQYSLRTPYGLGAPVFLTAVVWFDTAFVFLARVLQGKNPLRGSNDHLALRLRERWHLATKTILFLYAGAALVGNAAAYALAQGLIPHVWEFYVLSVALAGGLVVWLLQKTSTCTR